MKPSKPFALRLPMRNPPTALELKARSLRLMRMQRAATGESGDEAYARACRTMPWASAIADKSPYFSRTWWIWTVRESYFAGKEAA